MSSLPVDRSSGSATHSVYLREVLRTLRHFALMRRNDIAQTAGRAGSPIADITQFALRRTDRVASMAEEMVKGHLARPAGADLAQARAHDRASAAEFAAAAYAALRRILPQLGARHALVSELKLARVWSETSAPTDTLRAAALMQAMAAQGVIGHAELDGSVAADEADLATLAFFALMLFMLSGHDAGDAQEAVRSSVLLTLALRGDIMKTSGETAAIAALFEEFRHHV